MVVTGSICPVGLVGQVCCSWAPVWKGHVWYDLLMFAEGDCLCTGLCGPEAYICHMPSSLRTGTTAGRWRHIPLISSAWRVTVLLFCGGSPGPRHTTSRQSHFWGWHGMGRVPQLGPVGSVDSLAHRWWGSPVTCLACRCVNLGTSHPCPDLGLSSGLEEPCALESTMQVLVVALLLGSI